MADGTRNTSYVKANGGIQILQPAFTLKSAAQQWQGDTLFRDQNDSGLAKAATSGASMVQMYEPIGVATANLLGDGTAFAPMDAGLYERETSGGGDAVPANLPLGWPLYAADNRTVALTDGSGSRPKLGVFGGMSGEGKPLVWIGCDPYGLRELVLSFAIGHADLTAAATTQDFTLYTLPGPAIVTALPWVRGLTAFSGGGTGSATLAIGADSDPDAIGDEIDVFTGAAAAPKIFTAGVNGAVGYPLAAGVVIKARVATDTTVAAFTAGAVHFSLRLKPGSY